MVPQRLVDEFQSGGFTIAQGLFSEAECDAWRTYFTDMVERGGDGWAEEAVDPNHSDPLKRYPRLLQPHRGDERAMAFMIDPRVNEHLTALAGGEPLAVQTMVYFKPPGARGQNLHQDNTYLLAQPGTCLAAWLALEDIDEENGCMVLVKGSQNLPILCQIENPGISSEYWSDYETPIPPGMEAIPAVMKKGDVLFFNGSMIHGSGKNTSETRFRRVLIGHYIAAEATEVAKYYFPVYRMDGSVVQEFEVAPGGGPCGVYVEKDGEMVIEMVGVAKEATSAH